MRLVHLTSIHPDWDVRIWKLARSCAARGHEVTLACPWAVPDGTVRDGVTLRTFLRPPGRLRRPLVSAWRIRRLLRSLSARPDVLHFHDPDLLPYMATQAGRAAVVYDVHENYPDEVLVRDSIPGFLKPMLHRVLERIESHLARRCGHAVLVAPSQAPRFRAACREVFELRNYASLGLLAGAWPDDLAGRGPVIAFTGAHYESNGSLLLLAAVALVRERVPDAKVLVGDRFASEAFRASFLARRAELGLDAAVEIVPRVPSDRIMEILNRCRLGVSPNLDVPKQRKAIPTKIFEYMAAGIPFVASDLPAAREIAAAGGGVLVPAGDPRALAEAIVRLLGDEPTASALGRQGREAFIARFSWESQLDGLDAFYRRIARDSAGAVSS